MDAEPAAALDQPVSTPVAPSSAPVHSAPQYPAVPSKIDVENPREDKPPVVPVQPMSGLERAGIQLAWGVLTVIAFLATLLVVMVAIDEFGPAPPEVVAMQALVMKVAGQTTAPPSDATLKLINDALVHLKDAHKESRSFWVGFTQLLLVNVLLPVLTAILGYIFGSRRQSSG